MWGKREAGPHLQQPREGLANIPFFLSFFFFFLLNLNGQGNWPKRFSHLNGGGGVGPEELVTL